jgi:hypothetical protein
LSRMNKHLGGSSNRVWPLFVGLPLTLAIALAAVLLSTTGERPQPAGHEKPAGIRREEASQDVEQLGHPALGNADAPVVMIEYGDFQ